MTTNSPFLRCPHHPPPTTPDAPYHQLASKPSEEIYALMGEQGIRQMIRQFYLRLHNSSIKEMFVTRDLEESIDRSSTYFIWLLGGQPLFQQKYGSPKLRARHLRFVITESSRKVWLHHFYEVLDHPEGFSFPAEHLEGFKQFLDTFSRWMVNHADNGK